MLLEKNKTGKADKGTQECVKQKYSMRYVHVHTHIFIDEASVNT